MDSSASQRAFILLRYTLIAATAYLLMVEDQFALPPLGIVLVIVLALASNVVIAQLPARITQHTSFGIALVVANAVGTVGFVGIAAAGVPAHTSGGVAVALACGAYTAIFAVLQYLGVRRLA